MKKSTTTRVAMTAVGTLLLAGVAGAAIAEDAQLGDNNVGVSVEIAPLTTPGILAMTVDGSSTALLENNSTALGRTFTGTLPTVTVTDTRTADEIPEGAAWYVLGSSSVFTGDAGQPEIGAEHLGWAPRLTVEDDAGLVAPGDTVDTVLDGGVNGVGLAGQELFAIAAGSGEAAEGNSQWSATADLTLKTGVDVPAGNYNATLTLSLFE
ncbi:hypothetical protein ART_0868 [Arthrobacter sp. PAMC 25486]|uniref:hypothetical protein n=1 Tax=Arthrobacter sp. PAMC 25486 TaxID=1494608 RepID=UPI000535B4ED|nr:hypothetical protein [Arthrobacter sp. PAMC 25486]AIY00467.1 hypothetical protein ART_0868 [Arthrobacter sp. PAMC 25486]